MDVVQNAAVSKRGTVIPSIKEGARDDIVTCRKNKRGKRSIIKRVNNRSEINGTFESEVSPPSRSDARRISRSNDIFHKHENAQTLAIHLSLVGIVPYIFK